VAKRAQREGRGVRWCFFLVFFLMVMVVYWIICYLGERGSIKGSKVGFKIFFFGLFFLNGKMCGILE